MKASEKTGYVIGRIIKAQRRTRPYRIGWHKDMDRRFANNVAGRKTVVCPYLRPNTLDEAMDMELLIKGIEEN